MNFLDVLFGNLITFTVFAAGALIMIAIAVRAVRVIMHGGDRREDK